MELKKEIEKYLEKLNKYKTPNIIDFPDLDLYMDQVVTIIDKTMNLFLDNEEDKIVTSSMINNYVKANLIPSPISKKYSKLHLAYIISICTLKQSLSISEIDQILNSKDNKDFITIYENFRTYYDQSLSSNSNKIKKTIVSLPEENLLEELKKISLNLAIEATINKTISEKILSFINQRHDFEIDEIRQKTISDDKKTNKE